MSKQKAIAKDKLIAKVSKQAGISLAKAKAAYECILKENPSFRKQALKTVQAKKEVAVKIASKPKIKTVKVRHDKTVKLKDKVEKIKKVELVKEKAVATTKTVEKIKTVEVIKEVPVEVIKEVTLLREVEVEVIKEIPVEVVKEVEVEVIKEVPVEIIKEVEVVKSIDFDSLRKMMSKMGTVEISKKVVGETVTTKEAKVVERRELKDGDKRTKVTAKATKTKAKPKKAKAKAKAKPKKKDDLKKIEGIGPAIEKLLHTGKITTFKKLSDTKVGFLRNILAKAGPRFQMHDPSTWAKQANLAAKGQWDKLKKLQDVLDGGRKK